MRARPSGPSQHPLERRPERGEPLLDVLVDLAAHLRGLGLRLPAEGLGPGDRGAVDLGLGDQLLVLGLRLGDQRLGWRAASATSTLGLGLGLEDDLLGVGLRLGEQLVGCRRATPSSSSR